MSKTVQERRKVLLRRIKSITIPQLKSDLPLPPGIEVKAKKLWVPCDCAGQPTGQTFKVKAESFVGVQGFTSKCVLIKTHEGHITAAELKSLPIEDLHKVVKWAKTRFITPFSI